MSRVKSLFPIQNQNSLYSGFPPGALAAVTRRVTTKPRTSAPFLSSKTSSEIAHKRGLPADSLAFFGAMNDCRTASRHLHPVCGRNSGIVKSWTTLISPLAPWAPALMSDVSRNFEANLELLGEICRLDPLIKQGHLFLDKQEVMEDWLGLPAATLMFWMRSNAIIEVTDALEHLLVESDLGSDLPVDLLRPLFPACYIRFGKTFQKAMARHAPECAQGSLQGAYIFESIREEQRALTVVPVLSTPGSPLLNSGSLELIIRDENQPLQQQIHLALKADEQGMEKYYEALMQLMAKVFLYMSLEKTERIEEYSYTMAQERLSRLGAKKAARFSRHLMDMYDRFIVGPQTIHFCHQGERAPHLRRGHFRLQPCGPQNAFRKVIFIAPTWVRSDRLIMGP